MIIEIIELRIGNFVKCTVSNDAGVYSIVAMDGIHLKIMLDGARYKTWYSEGKINGIELTEEWLIKLGFKKTEMMFSNIPFIRFKIDKFLITRETNYFSCILFNDLEQEVGVTYVTSVHQLQNLYFALTGKELRSNI